MTWLDSGHPAAALLGLVLGALAVGIPQSELDALLPRQVGAGKIFRCVRDEHPADTPAHGRHGIVLVPMDAPGVTVSWKWAAAVYTSFSTDYNALGVKPVDSNTLSVVAVTVPSSTSVFLLQ